jgi:microcystin-dependent protein
MGIQINGQTDNISAADGSLSVGGTLNVTGNITGDGSLNVTGNITGDGAVPPGTLIFHCGNTAPSGFLKANGATISRSTYSALFAGIGTTFGTGDGSTTFTLPDMRGEFPRGWDDGRGIDSGRAFGAAQGDEFKSHTHTRTFWSNGAQGSPGLLTASPGTAGGSQDPQTSSSGGTETRPRNIALLACIKY